MDKEYRMDVTIEEGRDKPKALRDVLSMLGSKGIAATAERDAEGEVCAVIFSAEPGQGRNIADAFLQLSEACRDAAIRIGYEEKESGSYGYGVVRNGKVLDSFMEERRERASPLEEELRREILEGHQSFEEAYRLHEPEADRQPEDSVYLLLGWNSCRRVLEGKTKELMEERLDGSKTSFSAGDAYGAYFRKLAAACSSLGREQMEKLDEEIAFSMLRAGYRPKEISKAIQTRSPCAKVFVKPGNLSAYASRALQSARRELGRASAAR